MTFTFSTPSTLVSGTVVNTINISSGTVVNAIIMCDTILNNIINTIINTITKAFVNTIITVIVTSSMYTTTLAVRLTFARSATSPKPYTNKNARNL
jgi:spore coat protein CotF